MIINNPFIDLPPQLVEKIEQQLDAIKEMIKERKQGFGENWNDERENELQTYLDEVSEQLNFDFRHFLMTLESLYKDDYKHFIVYG